MGVAIERWWEWLWEDGGSDCGKTVGVAMERRWEWLWKDGGNGCGKIGRGKFRTLQGWIYNLDFSLSSMAYQ